MSQHNTVSELFLTKWRQTMQPLNHEIVRQIADKTSYPIWLIEILLGRPAMACTISDQNQASELISRAKPGSEEEYVIRQQWHKLVTAEIQAAQTVKAVNDAIAHSELVPAIYPQAIARIEYLTICAAKDTTDTNELLEILNDCIADGPAERMIVTKLYNMMMLSVPTRK